MRHVARLAVRWAVFSGGLAAGAAACGLGTGGAGPAAAPEAAGAPQVDAAPAVDAAVPPPTSSPDASTDSAAAPGPDCTRAAQARTAAATVFDAFMTDEAALTAPADREARVTKLLADVAAGGGAPLEDPAGDRVVFLVQGAPAAGPWSIAGSFTGWSSAPLAMTSLAGTDLYYLDTHVPRGQAEQYKPLSGTQDSGYVEDLLARNVVWDGIDRGTVGQFNGVVHAVDGDPTKGRLVALRGVRSQVLGDARDVFVYLPATYDDPSCPVLPHMVFHDGNESLTRGGFAGVADTTYASQPGASAVLVFVALPNQAIRTNEYTFGTPGAIGDAYGQFLATELEPIVAAGWRVCSAADARGISGASLGGLISTYFAFGSPTTWGYVGAQSASYFWDNSAMIARASEDPIVGVRFYLDTGCPDTIDNCDVVRQMNGALSAKGYQVSYVEVANAQHDWPYWAARLPTLLADFRANKSGCQ